MSVSNYDELRVHIGHDVKVVAYGKDGEDPANIAIECNDCNEVLLDFDYEDLCQCCSCEQCFDKETLNVESLQDSGRCPFCGSCNWVSGYIDSEE